jgi:hypothetical protein
MEKVEGGGGMNISKVPYVYMKAEGVNLIKAHYTPGAGGSHL